MAGSKWVFIHGVFMARKPRMHLPVGYYHVMMQRLEGVTPTALAKETVRGLSSLSQAAGKPRNRMAENKSLRKKLILYLSKRPIIKPNPALLPDSIAAMAAKERKTNQRKQPTLPGLLMHTV